MATKRKHNPCRCVGSTLRFTRGECFTCGRMLGEFIGQLESDPRANGTSAGLGALLHAVGKTRDRMESRRERDRELRALTDRPPRPRPANARRVVIEPPPQAKSEKTTKRAAAARVPRSSASRAVEFATRSF